MALCHGTRNGHSCGGYLYRCDKCGHVGCTHTGCTNHGFRIGCLVCGAHGRSTFHGLWLLIGGLLLCGSAATAPIETSHPVAAQVAVHLEDHLRRLPGRLDFSGWSLLASK